MTIEKTQTRVDLLIMCSYTKLCLEYWLSSMLWIFFRRLKKKKNFFHPFLLHQLLTSLPSLKIKNGLWFWSLERIKIYFFSSINPHTFTFLLIVKIKHPFKLQNTIEKNDAINNKVAKRNAISKDFFFNMCWTKPWKH
jgi:hypothetical protein